MITAIIGSALILFIILLYLMIALGCPYGEYIMGGKYKVFPEKKRFVLIIAIVIQIIMGIVLLHAAHVINLGLSDKLMKIVGYVFATYISLNVFMNFFSKSKKEQLLMTPVSLIMAICYWVTLLNI